jgi:hypothetical protein
LHSADVSPRHVEFPALVVADLANAGLTFRDRTAVSAGEAANSIAINFFVKLSFADVLIEYFAEGGHRIYL